MEKALSDITFPVAQPIVTLSGGTWRWLVIAALVIVELSWTAWLGVSADLSLKKHIIILATVLAAISFIGRRLNFHMIGDVFESVAQVLIFLMVANTLSCLLIATSGNSPLADGLLARIDSAMGLSWVAWWNFLQGFQTVNSLFTWIYKQTYKEYGLVLLYLCVTEKRQESERLLWASSLSLLIVIAISAYIPAFGAGYYYGVNQPSWIKDMNGLRAHTGDIVNSFGSVSCPSFHTVLALLLIDAVRHNKWLLGLSLAFNGLMLLAIPTVGSHYFIDIIAGAAVTAIVLYALNRIDLTGSP
jgi:hypothetical protein